MIARHATGGPTLSTDDRTFMFLHLMKTGGTTLGAYMNDSFPLAAIHPDQTRTADWVRYGSLDDLRALTDEQRARLRAYRGHYPYLATEIVEPDVTFTVLRDPVERTVSLLRQVQRAGGERPRPLEEIYEEDPARWTMVQDYQSRQFALTAGELEEAGRMIDAFFPDREARGADVAHYVYVPMDDTRLVRALATIDQVDEVGFQDDLSPLLATLERRYGWRTDRQHRRRVDVDREDVPDALRRRIAADNAYDVEFYREVRRRRQADGGPGQRSGRSVGTTGAGSRVSPIR